MTLQQQVQQHLANTGISLRELSRRSGVSHTTIGKILRGGEYKNGTLFVGRANMRTKYEYSLMRLRVYVWILIVALVFVLVGGLVVWGGV